jgi:hypothetical protein
MVIIPAPYPVRAGQASTGLTPAVYDPALAGDKGDDSIAESSFNKSYFIAENVKSN